MILSESKYVYGSPMFKSPEWLPTARKVRTKAINIAFETLRICLLPVSSFFSTYQAPMSLLLFGYTIYFQFLKYVTFHPASGPWPRLYTHLRHSKLSPLAFPTSFIKLAPTKYFGSQIMDRFFRTPLLP